MVGFATCIQACWSHSPQQPRRSHGGKSARSQSRAPTFPGPWLEAERHNSISTCNQRLAAVSSFFRWLQSQDPTRMAGCQDILAVPAKRTAQPSVNHLTIEQTRRLLAEPDRSTRRGRRDATLLATLCDTAARVEEFADLTVRGHPPPAPALAVLTGKARKPATSHSGTTPQHC